MFCYPEKFFKWLLPFTCLLCGQPADRAQDLCSRCLNDLPAYHNGCPQCGRQLAAGESRFVCGGCLQTAPPFQTTHILFRYEAPVTRLLTRLKFRHYLIAARLFGELLAEQVTVKWYRHQSLPDIILPVPLHASRLRERGYNQTLEIARPVAKILALPLWPEACKRLRPTLPQTTLTATARHQNVQQAFAVNRDIRGLHIAVVEDVITTGSTLFSLCKTLSQSGAGRIDIWCCARGMPVLPKPVCV